MKVTIITEAALNKEHGTGAQLLAMFSGEDVDFSHFYWHDGHNLSDSHRSQALFNPTWKFRRGAGIAEKVNFLSGKGWWLGGEIQSEKLKRCLKSKSIFTDVAYIVIAAEYSAERALSIISELGCPYVVHIMDIYHDELNPEQMPHFQKLFQGASLIFATTENIKTQVVKFDVENVEVISIGQRVTSSTASPPSNDAPIRVLMAGRPYPGGVELLKQSLPLIQKLGRIELRYAGLYFQQLPEELRRHMKDLGQINNRELFEQTLSESHLAFLDGPSELDHYGLYSFPSRSSDFLMTGLPVLGCVAAGSAAEKTLSSVSPTSVQFVRTPEEVVRAISEFTASEERWLQASQGSRQFAIDNMSIDAVKARIFAALERASQQHEAPSGLR